MSKFLTRILSLNRSCAPDPVFQELYGTPFGHDRAMSIDERISALRRNIPPVSCIRRPAGVRVLLVVGSVIIFAIGAFVISRVDWKVRIYALGRRCLTWIVDYGRRPVITPTHQLRTAFRETLTPKIGRSDPTHTHPVSAAWRSSCSIFGRLLAAKVGLRPFIYQASAVDVKNGFVHSREYHWAKDVNVPPSFSKPLETDLVIIVDVDYYTDIDALLISIDGPVLLYTFQPNSVATATGEFSFTFDHTNHVNYKVSGGASYKHKVWNYGVDVITVTRGWYSRYYLVERRKANVHHEFILLVPLGTWFGIFSLFANMLSSTKLQTVDVVHGDFAILDVHTDSGIIRSVGRLGEYNPADVDVKIFDAIGSVVRNSSLKTGHATMQSWMGEKFGASTLVDYFRQNKIDHPMTVYAPTDGILKYQIVKTVEGYEPERPALMQAFMAPVYPATFVPDRSVNNEMAAVQGRIILPGVEAMKLAQTPPSKWLLTAMDDFVKLLIPDSHVSKGVPYSVEDVYMKQDRPTQRSLLDRADSDEPSLGVETFLKAEPYLKASDPRIISTYNTVVKREYSAFIYALADHIMQEEWYSFGKSPADIAAMVANICSVSPTGVSCSDANRMDGHIFAIIRDLERMVLLRFFPTEHHSKLIDLHGSQYNCKAKTTQKVRYNIEYHRGSGSAETALFNSIVSKFNDFLARRMVDVSPIDAYNAPGQFGGDDVIASALLPGLIGGTYIVKAAAMIGQSVEVDEFPCGSAGVNYLSRFYNQDVWSGDMNTTCDLRRTLSKLHVTPNIAGFTPLIKLSQKLAGLCRTDRCTPIIKDIIATAVRVGLDISMPLDKRCTSYWAKYDAEVNWPNILLDDETAFLNHWFVKHDIEALKIYLGECKTPDDLLKMPSICLLSEIPIIVTQPTIVSEVFHTPSVSDVAPLPVHPSVLLTESGWTPAVPKWKPGKRGVCHEFLQRKCRKKPGECKFEHVQVCIEFQNGNCKRIKCKYEHLLITALLAQKA